jgi:uncharacterized OB-fold protein
MEIARHWRLKDQRYNLIGSECSHCKKQYFPPREVCPACGKEIAKAYHFSGLGEVYSFTTIYEAPSGYDEEAPYTVALVQLEEGPLVTAQLTDLGAETPEIGMPVEMVTRRIRSDGDERGMLIYGYKFRPRLQKA